MTNNRVRGDMVEEKRVGIMSVVTTTMGSKKEVNRATGQGGMISKVPVDMVEEASAAITNNRVDHTMTLMDPGVAAMGLKIVLVEAKVMGMTAIRKDTEGVSFKRVEDQGRALEATSTPARLPNTPSSMAAATAACSRRRCPSWVVVRATSTTFPMSTSHS